MPVPERAHGRASWARTFVWALLGALLLQVSWAVAVPPFRGLDEHDHAYKAAAVALGDWSAAHPPSAHGIGEMMVVPRDIVEAAGPVCESLPYTHEENCTPGRAGAAPGTVEVASTAARYNPVFYFVIGTPARLFTGSDALYAMRATSALLCALLLALAFAACRPWSSSRWPATSILLAATPVLMYSNAVAAPNGIELCAALLVWSALLGFARGPDDAVFLRRCLVLATIGAVPLATVRSLGPLWLLLILAVCAVLTPPERRAALRRSTTARVCAAVAALSVGAGAGWTLRAGTNEVTPIGDPFTGLGVALPRQFVLWFFQSVGAFPARNEPAPLLTYAIVFAAWGVLAVLGWRLATRRQRLALAIVFVVSALIPLAVTIRSYHDAGPLWQGRYGYPFALGFLLICGQVLAARDPRPRRALPVVIAAAVTAVAQPVCQLAVARKELRTSPLAGSEAWLTLPPAVIVAVSVAGAAALAVASLQRAPGAARQPAHRADAVAGQPQPTVAATHF
jgi:uncharacterized membrane protein HdeD (DUF308 family)